MDRVDIRVGEHICELRISPADPEFAANSVKRSLVLLANRDQLCVRVMLVNGDELGPESETDETYAYLSRHFAP